MMVELVGDVGEIGGLWPKRLDDLQPFVDGEMRLVRLRPEHSQNQHIEIGEQVERCFGYGAYVRDIGKIADPVSKYVHCSVHNLDRSHRDAVYGERALHRDQFKRGLAASDLGGDENILERPSNRNQRRFQAVASHDTAGEIVEPPDVVEAEEVVRMSVGEENRIDSPDALAQHLGSEIGRSVDKEVDSIDLDKCRGPGAHVVGIIGAAYRAVAADHRDAMRSARAQERNPHLSRPLRDSRLARTISARSS